jgi:hypothetical protein
MWSNRRFVGICRVLQTNLSGCMSGFSTYPTKVYPVESIAYVRFVGFVGFYKEKRGPGK